MRVLTDSVTNLEALGGSPFLVVWVANGGPTSRVPNLVHCSKRHLHSCHGHHRHQQNDTSLYPTHHSLQPLQIISDMLQVTTPVSVIFTSASRVMDMVPLSLSPRRLFIASELLRTLNFGKANEFETAPPQLLFFFF